MKKRLAKTQGMSGWVPLLAPVLLGAMGSGVVKSRHGIQSAAPDGGRLFDCVQGVAPRTQPHLFRVRQLHGPVDIGVDAPELVASRLMAGFQG